QGPPRRHSPVRPSQRLPSLVPSGPSHTYSLRRLHRPTSVTRGCCENCWDSDGKMWGILGNEGEGTTAGLPRKIKGVAAFSMLCYSPSGGIKSPLLCQLS